MATFRVILALLLLSLLAVGEGLPQLAQFVEVVPQDEEPEQPMTRDHDQLVCLLCTDLLQNMTKYLGANVTQEDVEDAVKRLCPSLPSDEEMKCRIAVKVLGPLMFNQTLNPRLLCEDIALCPARPVKRSDGQMAEGLDSSPLPRLQQLLTLPPSDKTCDVCLFTMNSLLKIFTSNTTRELVKKGVEKLCHLAPCGLRAQCSSLLHEYFPMVVTMTAEHFIRPREICQVLELCYAGKTGGADQDLRHVEDSVWRFVPPA